VNPSTVFGFTLRWLKWRVIGAFRGIILRSRGHKIINPFFKGFHAFPSRSMEREFRIVLKQIGISRFPVMIEHGCGNGSHYTRFLRKYTDKLIGVDVIDSQFVSNVDEYVKVPIELRPDYFPDLPDQCIDAVVILCSVGFNVADSWIHKVSWRSYFNDATSRQGRYLTQQNYFRLLKKGGHLVIIEWDHYPEFRFGRLSRLEGLQNIASIYDTPEIFGFRKVAEGYTEMMIGPYLVLQRN
jgi:hypothetical protein